MALQGYWVSCKGLCACHAHGGWVPGVFWACRRCPGRAIGVLGQCGSSRWCGCPRHIVDIGQWVSSSSSSSSVVMVVVLAGGKSMSENM